MAITRLSLTGLSYRTNRKTGKITCYWVAPVADKDYQPRTVNVTHLINKPAELKEAIDELNHDHWHWKIGLGKHVNFGTIKSLIDNYQIDKESPFQELAPGTVHVYSHHLKWLKSEIGKIAIDKITGKDLKRWYNGWSNDRKNKSNGKMRVSVLRAVVQYGIQCRVKGCVELLDVIKATSRYLPGGGKREVFMTADQVIALRKAAHDDKRPNLALAYALVFETTLRLFDVVRQLDWSDIDDDLVVRFTPTKTEKKTGAKVVYPLKAASMVIEELAHHEIKKSGPVILMDNTDRRYDVGYIPQLFKKHAEAAGLPPEFIARDLRASGITEARFLGADIGDLSKVAGHSSTRTTSAIYDRATLAAANRVAELRSQSRTVQEPAQ